MEEAHATLLKIQQLSAASDSQPITNGPQEISEMEVKSLPAKDVQETKVDQTCSSIWLLGVWTPQSNQRKRRQACKLRHEISKTWRVHFVTVLND